MSRLSVKPSPTVLTGWLSNLVKNPSEGSNQYVYPSFLAPAENLRRFLFLNCDLYRTLNSLFRILLICHFYIRNRSDFTRVFLRPRETKVWESLDGFRKTRLIPTSSGQVVRQQTHFSFPIQNSKNHSRFNLTLDSDSTSEIIGLDYRLAKVCLQIESRPEKYWRHRDSNL